MNLKINHFNSVKIKQKGFAIALVLVFAMFMMIFAATLMQTAKTTRREGEKITKKIRASWLAASGVQLTLMKIKELREEFYDALKWSGNGKASGNFPNNSHTYPQKHPFHNLYFDDCDYVASLPDENGNDVITPDVVAGAPGPQFTKGKGGTNSQYYCYLDQFKGDLRSTDLAAYPSDVDNVVDIDTCIATDIDPNGQCSAANAQPDPYTGSFGVVMENKRSEGTFATSGWAEEGLIRLSSKLLNTGSNNEEYTEQDSVQIKVYAIASWLDTPAAGAAAADSGAFSGRTHQEETTLTKIEKLERHR
ncbi:MAG: hypothetical protein JXR91_12190 [Deltaproteobacteria bacterium]|nr:hypothetical protein [Deltaproteobacteria bacterium]